MSAMGSRRWCELAEQKLQRSGREVANKQCRGVRLDSADSVPEQNARGYRGNELGVLGQLYTVGSYRHSV